MIAKIQNIAIAGHGTSGKTTLVEELLMRHKSLSRGGKVEDGTSVLDHDPEERERKFTIDASTGSFVQDDHLLQIIDTPGYPDFLGATIDAFTAVETALIAVDAAAGVRVNTRRVWAEAGKQQLARLIVITRLDHENADFDARVEEIRATFGEQCIPMLLPDASGPKLSRLENTFHPAANSSTRAKELHKQLVEKIVEVDEKLLERYLADQPISREEIDNVFTQALKAGTVVPIMCCSSAKAIGLDELVELLLEVVPVHNDGAPLALENLHGEPLAGSPHGTPKDPFLARVFKVVGDPFVGKLSYMRIYAGTATHNMHVANLSRHTKERLTNLLRMQGKEQVHIETAGPGDIIAVPKLDSLHIGDSVGEPHLEKRLRSVPHPTPMVKLAVEAKSRNDDTKIWESLTKLSESDSTFKATRVQQTHELVIAGRSTLHLDVTLSRLKRRYGLEVNTHIPRTSYLESVTGNAETHYRHKKQSGGRGQFGECYVRVKPLPKGAGLVFSDNVVGGSIPRNLIPAVEKGMRELAGQGILTHSQVIDLDFELY
ncbi:MAG: GTP-binding protein, partial [Planctomycetota bacterium]